jgi:HlyD family secretion protein
VEVLIDEATDVLLVPNNAIVNTSDAGPAGMVLGLDIENMDLTQFQRAGRFGGQMAAAGSRGGATAGGAPRGGAPPDPGAFSGRGGAAGRFQPGDISADSARALAAAMRAGRGANTGGRGGAGFAGSGAGAAQRLARRVVVFTVPDTLRGAVPEPKIIEIGLNDWDRTQVLSGLEEGERVALIGAAQLQAQQAEFMSRMGSRMGGTPFGGGGGGRRR